MPGDMKTKSTRAPAMQARLRVRVGDEVALGPGKVELLELVAQTGSITAAARKMGISYMRAWTLIRTMNDCFEQPLVAAARGGSKGGGGAELTDTGRRVLALYQAMDAECFEATRTKWKQLQKLLRRRNPARKGRPN
jgi:molybdate transport system regulatory protein